MDNVVRPRLIIVLISAALYMTWSFCTSLSNKAQAAPVDVTTFKNDLSNSGVNRSEKILSLANVNAYMFGRLFTIPVDGEVFTQPLVKTGVHIKVAAEKGKHDVVYFATEHDSLFAVDANTGATLWQDSFIDPENGITAVPYHEVEADTNIFPEIGITGAPVIDNKLNTLFVSVETKEIVDGAVHYRQRLHAIDIETGQERRDSPVIIGDTENHNGRQICISGPTVSGTGDGNVNGHITFSAMHANQRPALLLLNGCVYVAFSSHDDIGPYHGWLMSFKESDLSLVAAFNTTPNGGLGGIWGGAAKPAVDSSGNIYFATGNGSFDSNLNALGQPDRGDYGNAIVKLAVDPSTTMSSQGTNGWGFKVLSYFVPSDFQYQNDRDGDIGSAGIALLPDNMGSPDHPHLLITGGKDSRLYLLDCANLTGFHSDHDRIVQEVNGATNRLFVCPTPYDGHVYFASDGRTMMSFTLSNAQLGQQSVAQSSHSFGFPGATASISANGNSNAILWSLDRNANALYAFDVDNFPKVLYTSNDDGDDTLGVAVRFTIPTVANGRVYAGTEHSLVCYGLLPSARTIVAKGAPAPSTLGPLTPTNANGIVKGGEVDLTWQNNANNAQNYIILRKTGSAGTYTTLAFLPPTAVSYADTDNIQAHTDYEYHILAVNAAGNSDFAGFLAHVP